MAYEVELRLYNLQSYERIKLNFLNHGTYHIYIFKFVEYAATNKGYDLNVTQINQFWASKNAILCLKGKSTKLWAKKKTRNSVN